MATIPPMNLGQEAAPWGREIQARLQNQEQEIARLKQDTENALRALNGAISNQGQQSFAAPGYFNISLPLSASGMTSAIGTTISFKITERRLVSAICTTNYRYEKTSGGNSSGSGVVSVNLAGINSYGSIFFGTGAATGSQGGSVVGTYAMVLDPGTYSVSCGAELYVTNAVSAPGGSVTMTDAYLLQVQVLGRV